MNRRLRPGWHPAGDDFYSGSARSGWQNLAGTVSGDPAVTCNPRYGTTEVRVLSGTHVTYRYLSGIHLVGLD